MSEEKGYDDEEKRAPLNFSWMPSGCKALADGEYDAIIMGTGLTECIISGLLSVQGKRVLHVDRNNYYGAETASLSLTNIFQKFKGDGAVPNASLGASRDWNIDLIPKFIMACGKLVKILLHSKVTRYLEFRSIDGSFVFKDGKVQKVPATPAEALNSSLMGFFEKRKFRNFLIFVQNYDKTKPSTFSNGKNMDQMTARELYAVYGLDANTQSFTGHAMALEANDEDYMDKPASRMVEAIQLYAFSLERYGKSPYIYPIYGLGGLPEGFSRLCAIHGGTFMLNRGVDQVLTNDGVAWGIRSGDEVAKADLIIGDPSYFKDLPDKCKVIGQVVRSICLLDHPINGTDKADSVQIIIPGAQVKRRNDIYVCMVSYAHNVCSDAKYIAIVSTTVETANPMTEVSAGIQLLGTVIDRFDSVSDLYEPLGSGAEDHCYISKSYDATSHFETQSDDVLSLYARITGTELDMNISADLADEE